MESNQNDEAKRVAARWVAENLRKAAVLSRSAENDYRQAKLLPRLSAECLKAQAAIKVARADRLLRVSTKLSMDFGITIKKGRVCTPGQDLAQGETSNAIRRIAHAR